MMEPIDSGHSPSEAVLRALLVCDLVGSTRLTTRLGDARAAEIFARHDQAARSLLNAHHGIEIDKTDGFLLLFERPVNAVLFALAYHEALKALSESEGVELQTRVGIHLGEVVLRENTPEQVARGAKPLEVEGIAKPTAARVMAIALGGQTLLTRAGFDLARRALVGVDLKGRVLKWLAHGSYLFKGVEEPLEIFEVGLQGLAPLAPPAGGEKAQRIIGDGKILGWRPGPGLEIPQRPNWLVERKLGEGGFGEVWLATHQKTHDKRVFKFCYDAKSLHTLKRETTLFRLLKGELGDREDIARILDWNFEEAPYFIESEYTEGGSLIDWAAQQGGLLNVPLPTRLEVIAQISEALAAAHSVGVLHKDVKPANVLIATSRDGKPHALLTDFGIGRVTDEERLKAAGITRLGLTEMAPALGTSDETGGTRLYMAPELVEGKAATVQADIYALGVLLYQVIVGDFSRSLAPGWQREVEDELLREDIAIAVDGSPSRRLGNAIRMAERLRSLEQRHAELVARRAEREEARRAKVALQAAKRRRKLMLVAIAVLAVFGGTMTILAQRIASERDRANREAEKASQVAGFMLDIFEVSDPSEARGNRVTAREILDKGVERVERELADQPAVQATLMDTMGGVYTGLGLYQQATQLLEKALSERRALYGARHLEVAQSVNRLGRTLELTAQYERAEALFREALALRRDLLGPQHVEVADSMTGLARALTAQGKYSEAEALFREALTMRRKLLGAKDPSVAETLEDLALCMYERGDYEAPVPLLEEALAMRRELHGAKPHPAVADVINNLAYVLYAKGDHARAEELFREALQIQRALYQGAHPFVALGLNNLAFVLHDRGDYAGAERTYREALAMQREWLGKDHPDIALTLNNLAFVLHDQGKLEAATAMSRESLEMYRRVYRGEHPLVARGLGNLARWLHESGDEAAAEPMMREALAMRRKLLGESHADVATSLCDLADLLVVTGRFEEAYPLAAEAHRSFASNFSEDHWRTAVAKSIEGAALVGLRRYDDAEPLLQASYQALEEGGGARVVHRRDALVHLVALYDAWGREQQAGKYRQLLAREGTSERR